VKRNDDPTSLIGQIDIHLTPTNDVFTRFGTSPTIGLESSAVQRRAKDGKNTISNPPTQHWKKALNYVFGGFNFLMWITFIVTIVRSSFLIGYDKAEVQVPVSSCRTSLLVAPNPLCSILASPSCFDVLLSASQLESPHSCWSSSSHPLSTPSLTGMPPGS
jgi:hypothetical protein